MPANGSSRADGRSVEMAAGFETAKLYEFVYEGKDPVVAGTGLAGIRDWISYLKHEGQDGRPEKRAIGFGISQSGRFLREFLYDGFNADEQGRPVFDGVWADVAGAGRGSFNFRYAQPSRDGCPFINVFYPTDVFPFVDTRAARARPRRQGRAEALPDEWVVRVLGPRRFARAPHAGRQERRAALARHPRLLHLRACSTARIRCPSRKMERATTCPPPISGPSSARCWPRCRRGSPMARAAPSKYPKLSAGELTTPDRIKTPRCRGVAVPQHPRRARKLDFGPEFAAKGFITKEPPAVEGEYPLLVPQVDADGIDLGGIRLPEIAVPLATITGWNLRAPERGASEEMVEFLGSFWPFPKTREDRARAHDTRLSIAERYPTRDEYLKRVERRRGRSRQAALSCSLRTATGPPKEPPNSGTRFSSGRSVHFRDHFDFDAAPERDLRHAERAAGVQSVLAEDRGEQL